MEFSDNNFASGKTSPSLLVSFVSSSTGYTTIKFRESNTAVFSTVSLGLNVEF